jgi:hypothetical protein
VLAPRRHSKGWAINLSQIDLLTTKQAAERIGWHVKTLYKALRENTISLNYIQTSPRRFGFRPADVQRYLDDREVVRTGDSPRKPRREKTNRSVTKKGTMYRWLSDVEAQQFFQNVQRDDDGSLIGRDAEL